MTTPDPKTPFMFAYPDSQYAQATSKMVMSHRALLSLIEACEKSTDPDEKNALLALKKCLDQGYLRNFYFDLGILRDKFKPGDYDVDRQKEKSSSIVFAKCLLIAAPSQKTPTFAPSHYGDVTVDPASWGWVVQSLLDHEKALKSLAKKISVTINWRTIKNAALLQAAKDNGELTVRTMDHETGNDETSFVLYDTTNKKYISKDGYANASLARALLFESVVEAKGYAKKKGVIKSFAVICVDVRLNSVALNPENKDLGALAAALAQRQKEELEKVLKDLSIEQLKNRLAELEGGLPQPARKKM